MLYNFCKNHLTDSFFSYVKDKILNDFYVDILTGAMLIDLKKFFYTINHNILLKKYIFRWIFSLINCRRFQVNIKNKHSDAANIN